MPGPLDGPLGPLPNMFWDPVRAKYFPNPRQSTAVPNQPRQERPNMRPPSPTRNSKTIMTHVKELSLDGDSTSSSVPPRSGPSTATAQARRNMKAFRRLGSSGAGVSKPSLVPSSHEDRMRGHEKRYWANLFQRGLDDIGVQGSRVYDIIAPWGRFDFLALYQNGLMMCRSMADDDFFLVDRDDVPVDSWIMPQIQPSTRCPRGFDIFDQSWDGESQMIRTIVCDLGELEGLGRSTGKDYIVQSSFEKSLLLASGRTVFKIDFGSETQSWLLARPGTSDMMALDQACPNIVYAGLRDSQIISGDFRDSRRELRPIATLNHKAVVNVKRLCDSAVPFGLLVSGMGNKLVVFDIRFTKQPLRELEGHDNPFHQDLGLGITPDGKYVFAGQGDRRVRAWSLRDGQRLLPDGDEPIGPNAENPLNHIFYDRVTAIKPWDGRLNVGVSRAVYHYGSPYHDINL